MKNSGLTGLFALIAAIGLSGCSTISSWVSGVESHLTTIDVRDEMIAVAARGPIAVDVESFGGRVTIEADPNLVEGYVTATRRGLHGIGRLQEAEYSLEQIAYSVELAPGELGQVLEIRATTTHEEPHFQRVDFAIMLPEIDGLKVRTQGGSVTATGIEGEVDIVTSDGQVTVATDRAMLRPVTILNNSGGINYRIRAESAGDFDCQAIRGRVAHNVKFGQFRVLPGTDHDTFLGKLNEGANRVVLRAADGDIYVDVIDAPTLVKFLGG